ncbi:MAG TPA: hypothetical protein VFL91_15495 [Thermomicrobiales bacterium]|nr:hypothetical protein [Thermomicrobiales bacterium]
MTTTQRRRELSGPEVEATLAAIRRRVRARHGLPPDSPDEEPAEARSALTEAMDAVHISAHTPILWTVPVVGRALALVKRVVRLLLRWYINPIVDQQNDFNAAAVRALNELAAGQEALRREIERRESGSSSEGSER